MTPSPRRFALLAAVTAAVAAAAVLPAAAAGEGPAPLRIVTPIPAAGARTVHAEVRAGGESLLVLGLGLPVTRQAAETAARGGRDYTEPHVPVAAELRRTGTGFRVLVRLGSAAAPRTFRFPLRLPAGTAAVARPDGSVGLVARNRHAVVELGTIAAPWARDASGRPVATSYRLAGTVLVQRIAPAPSARYPVTADPAISFGRWVYIRFHRDEVHRITHKLAGGASVAAAVCGLIPSTKWKTVCAGLAAYAFTHISSVFAKASAENRCVELKFAWSPVYRIRSYAC